MKGLNPVVLSRTVFVVTISFVCAFAFALPVGVDVNKIVAIIILMENKL